MNFKNGFLFALCKINDKIPLISQKVLAYGIHDKDGNYQAIQNFKFGF